MSRRLLDLTGRRFGYWLVLSLHERTRWRRGRKSATRIYWLCRCERCGTERAVVSNSLRNGESTSCGKCRRGPKFVDLTGRRFGRWIVVALRPRQGRRDYWLCRCVNDGVERVVRGADLRSGKSTNCGCVRRETTKRLFTKHGMSRTQIYARHMGMKQRCQNPNHVAYHNYGGRQINVCEYYCDFQNWFADMGEPSPGLTQDRIDNDRGYEPGNLQWTDRFTQVRNRRPPKKKIKRR